MRFGRHTYGTFAPALLVRAARRAGGYPIYGVARKEGGLVRSVIGVLLGLAAVTFAIRLCGEDD